MNKEFIPYELALQLKELGYNEISLFCYDTAYEGNPLSHCPHLLLNSQLEGFENEPISAPLWQQAFDWFRTKHNLFYVIHVHREGYSFNIHTLNKGGKEKEFLFSTILGSISSGIYIKDYNEAKLRALEKLISLVKESK